MYITARTHACTHSARTGAGSRLSAVPWRLRPRGPDSSAPERHAALRTPGVASPSPQHAACGHGWGNGDMVVIVSVSRWRRVRGWTDTGADSDSDSGHCPSRPCPADGSLSPPHRTAHMACSVDRSLAAVMQGGAAQGLQHMHRLPYRTVPSAKRVRRYREKERERQRETQRERQRHTHTHTHTEREREREGTPALESVLRRHAAPWPGRAAPRRRFDCCAPPAPASHTR
jgi:hypothetical protein